MTTVAPEDLLSNEQKEKKPHNAKKGSRPSRESLLGQSAETVKSSTVAAEVRNSIEHSPKNLLSLGDLVSYALENRISADARTPFIILAILSSICLIVFGLLWFRLSNESDEDVYGQESPADGIFMALQLIISAGFDDSIPDEAGLRWVFFLLIFFGLVVFAVLVGFVTDSVSQFMNSLAVGRTKVAESSHTLILGWNEATLRCIVQISFLRRQYQILNEVNSYYILYYFPMLRPLADFLGLLERPSTSLANNDIVIMTDTISKEEMHILLEHTLSERGISPNRTKLGQNIICRIGDPTNVNDLIRVGAHRAAAILVMMTEQDQEEEDESDGKIFNGATLRCALALRHVLFTNPYSPTVDVHPDLRIVLQMTSPSAYVDAACFEHPDGRDVIIPMDLSVFLNSLMFSCAAQPGLSQIILSILDFEGSAIRRRKAKNLRSGPEDEYGYCVGKTFGEMRREFSTAVFIGIIRPGMARDEIASAGFGLCPDPQTVIEEEDMLIFIGPKSSPVHSHDMVETFRGYVETAKQVIAHNPQIAKNRDDHEGDHGKVKSNILICGWRSVWEENPKRLHKRLLEIVSQRLLGSTVTFLNGVDYDKFTEMMVECGMRRTPNNANKSWRVYELHSPYEGIFVRHIQGDSALPEVLEPVINDNTIHTAIVLGTQANIRLRGRSRDTRVLNIMLLLRKLWNVKHEGVPMHIVGENSEDMTAKLALAPQRSKRKSQNSSSKRSIIEHDPDFINSQAVYARALVQTLAYPVIRPAIADLFEDSRGSADIVIVDAADYVPINETMPYGVVRALVLEAKGQRSICVGVMHSDGHCAILPPHDNQVTVCVDDRLIILRRMIV
jgi:hypothetical protein